MSYKLKPVSKQPAPPKPEPAKGTDVTNTWLIVWRGGRRCGVWVTEAVVVCWFVHQLVGSLGCSSFETSWRIRATTMRSLGLTLISKQVVGVINLCKCNDGV